MSLVIHRVGVRGRLHRGFRPTHRVVHSLLSGNTHAFILVIDVRSDCVVLMAHKGVRLGNHWDLAAFTNLRLILIRILKKLQTVADLRLVKAVRIIRWGSRSCDRLLAGSLRGLVRRVVRALRLVKRPLLVIVRLDATRLAGVGLGDVARTVVLLLWMLLVSTTSRL